jgi:hypothetical protein
MNPSLLLCNEAISSEGNTCFMKSLEMLSPQSYGTRTEILLVSWNGDCHCCAHLIIIASNVLAHQCEQIYLLVVGPCTTMLRARPPCWSQGRAPNEVLRARLYNVSIRHSRSQGRDPPTQGYSEHTMWSSPSSIASDNIATTTALTHCVASKTKFSYMQWEQLVVGLYVLTAPGHENLAATIIMSIGMTKTNCKILSRPNVQNNDKCSQKS